ncbi:MAG: LysR family transcriptional regulator [Noviherbaspirillum sp.]
MDTHFLESFIAVAEHGSIAEAARRLKMTPSAMTQRIQALEQEIGARLLRRSGRTVMPTEAGTKVLQRARQLILQVEELKSLAMADEVAGELKLGAVSTALNGLLPDILAALSKRYPRLSVHVVPGTSEDLYAETLSGQIDAALIIQPEFSIPKTLGWHVLRNEPLVLLTPKEVVAHDPLDVLRTHPFVRYARTTVGGRTADRFLRANGIRPQDRFELASLAAIALLVDRGLGVSLVPDWAPPWPEGLSLNKLPIGNDGYVRRIGLVWSRASARLRLAQAFLDEAGKIYEG